MPPQRHHQHPNPPHHQRSRIEASSHHHQSGGDAERQVWVRGSGRRGESLRRAEERRLGYLICGIVCMIPGLILYFGGGYLFVASYNNVYPIWQTEVSPPLARIFSYIGPIFFFIGLVIFVVSYAVFCKGIDYTEDY